MSAEHKLQAPPAINGLKECRAALDLFTLPLRMSLLTFAKVDNIGRGRNVFVLPGFGASDTTMLPLRYYLERHGFRTFGWGLGTNKAGLDQQYDPRSISWQLDPPTPYKGEAGVAFLCDSMANTIRQFHAETKENVTLVGWSLGGTIAREVARDLPELVDHVMTLGSPLIGGPKYTAAAKHLAKKGLNLDWIENEVHKRSRAPLKCKASSIISPTDGVVGFSASVAQNDDTTRYIKMDVSHLGMGFNRKTLATLVDELRHP